MTGADQLRNLRALEADIVTEACVWQACGETADDTAVLRDLVGQYRRVRDEYVAAHEQGA